MSTSPGLYLHVPFCSAVCPYCDFAVTTGGPDRRERFTCALIQEITKGRESWAPFDTVYFGGGTPSALGDEQLRRILGAVHQTLAIVGGNDEGDRTGNAVVSIEANPENVTEASVRAWSGLGVGRLSLGVQSFDAAELKFLGRRHDPVEARRAVEIGLTAGLVVSMDLIYGLPQQSREGWQSNLETVVELEPHHVSCYQLTIEPGTPFARRSHRGDWSAPGNDAVAELFYLTHEFLGANGYPAYEVSNFSRELETQCDHNRKYWEGTSYLGLGPSAHSFDGRSRWWNERSESAWRQAVEAGAGQISVQMSTSPGLYLHVPFCSAVCPYCDFAVHHLATIHHFVVTDYETADWRFEPELSYMPGMSGDDEMMDSGEMMDDEREDG